MRCSRSVDSDGLDRLPLSDVGKVIAGTTAETDDGPRETGTVPRCLVCPKLRPAGYRCPVVRCVIEAGAASRSPHRGGIAPACTGLGCSKIGNEMPADAGPRLYVH